MRELRFILRFKSDASRALKATASGFRRLNQDVERNTRSLARMAVSLRAVSVGAKAAGASISRSLSGLSGVLNRTLGGVARLASAIGALGLVVGLGAAVRTVAEFGAQMSRVRAITIDTSASLEQQNLTMDALTATARNLGATTVFAASQAAEAMALLGQAGFNAGEIIQAVPATLDLAVAGATDLATASNIVANSIRGFGLAASESGRVADVFAATVTSANTNVVELGDALKFVAPVAKSLNVTLEESAAAVGILSNAGLKSTLAGTGLRRVLIGLATQTPKATKTLKAAGIEVDKLRETIASGKGLNAALKEFEGRQLSAAQAVEVFGLRGGPAFLILQDAADRLGSFSAALEESEGRAEEFARIARDNLAGDLKILRSVIEDTILGSGTLNTTFRSIVQTITGVIQSFRGTLDPLDQNAARYRQLAARIEQVTKLVLGFVIALKTLQIIGAISTGIGTLSGAFVSLTAAVGGATVGVKAFRLALIGTGIGLLVVAVGALIAKYLQLRGEIDPLDAQMKQTNKTVQTANELLEKTAGLTGNLALEQLPRYREELKRVQAEQDATTRSLGQFITQQEILARSDASFTDVFRSEQLTAGEKFSAFLTGLLPGTDAVTEAANRLAEKQHELGVQANETGRTLVKLKDRIEEGADLEEAQANIQGFRNTLESLGSSVAEQAKVISQFRADSEKLSDLRFDLAQAQIVGSGADLQRKINEELKDLGLLIEVPAELETGLVELNEKVLELQAKRADLQALEATAAANQLDELKAAQTELAGQLAVAETAQIEARETLELRRRQRAEVVRTVKAIEDEKERAKKLLAEEKALTKEREKQAELRINNQATIAALEREFSLIGLTARERERIVDTEKLIASNRKIGIQGLTEEQRKIFELQDALNQQRRSDVFGSIKTQLRDFAEEGTDVAARVSETFGTLFSGLESELVNFVKTGKFNFRDFADSVVDEFAKLGVRLLVSGVLQKIQGALTPEGGGQSVARGLLSQARGAAQGARAAAGFPVRPGADSSGVITQLKRGITTAQDCCAEQVSASGSLGKDVVGGLKDQGDASRGQEQGLFSQLFGRFDQATQFLLGLLKNGFGGLKTGLSSLFGGIKDGLGRLVGGLKSLGTSIVSGIKSAISGLGNILGGIVDGVTSAISSVLGGITSAIGNVLGPLVSVFGQLASQLGSAITSVLSSLISSVTEAVTGGLMLAAATEMIAAATILFGAATALLGAGALLTAGASLMIAAGTLMAAAAATLLIAASLQLVAATLMSVAAGIQIAAAAIQAVAAGLLIAGSILLVAGSVLLTVSSALLLVAALLLIAAGVLNLIPGFAKGGISDSPTGFVPAKSFGSPMFFADGGTTTGGDRIPAMLSPNEAVVPLGNNKEIPVAMQDGGRQQVNNFTFNISTPDVAGFNKSRKQIEADMATSLHRANERNN